MWLTPHKKSGNPNNKTFNSKNKSLKPKILLTKKFSKYKNNHKNKPPKNKKSLRPKSKTIWSPFYNNNAANSVPKWKKSNCKTQNLNTKSLNYEKTSIF